MSIEITGVSPSPGPYPPGSNITISGTGGPVATIRMVVAGGDPIISNPSSSAQNFSHVVKLPSDANATIVITVVGADGSDDEITVKTSGPAREGSGDATDESTNSAGEN